MLDLHLHIYHIFSSKVLGPSGASFLCVYWVVQSLSFVLLTLVLLVIYFEFLQGVEE